MPNSKANSHKNWMFFGRMVLEWRDIEHVDVDREFYQDINAQQYLKQCGFYKFWKLWGMRAQPRLPQMFIDY